MNIYKKVKNLNLPEGKYVVCAGSALEGHGIRKCGDIDIAVTKDVCNQLKRSGWSEITKSGELKVLIKDEFEVTENFKFGGYQATTKHLINTAIVIRGVPFANLQEIIKFKKAANRKKDKKDIKLIKKYLESQTRSGS